MRYINVGLVVILIFLVSCHKTFDVLQDANNVYTLTTIENLKDESYIMELESFYNSGKAGFFAGKSDIPIYYKIFNQPKKEKAAILISSGRTEATIKYKELIFDLYQNGYSVYIHDHRGQGLSGRMTEDPDLGYVDTFQFYIDDMKYFYDNMLKTANHKKVYLLAHSMGGAIGMTYLEQHHHDFDAAAFSSPMLGFSPMTCGATYLLSGKKIKYALGQNEYKEEELKFDKNELTRCEIRYHRMSEAYAIEPKARLGGPSYQWVQKSCHQFKYINDNIENTQTPFILFSAENEQVVDTKAHYRFIKRAKEHGIICEAFLIEDAQHELFFEKDEQRIKAINKIFEFYARY